MCVGVILHRNGVMMVGTGGDLLRLLEVHLDAIVLAHADGRGRVGFQVQQAAIVEEYHVAQGHLLLIDRLIEKQSQNNQQNQHTIS